MLVKTSKNNSVKLDITNVVAVLGAVVEYIIITIYNYKM